MTNTKPVRRSRTPLKDVAVTVPARAAGRRRDIPGRRPASQPITFDSAL